MLYAISLVIAGVLKIFSGVDLISFIFLYSLLFNDEFSYNNFLVSALAAEMFSFSFPGLYSLSYFLLYLVKRWQLKMFHGNRVFNFLFLLLGFISIRTLCNLSLLIGYSASMKAYLSSLASNLILIIILYFLQNYVEKCFPRYTKHP
ncbi:MAG: hypothetical protein P9L98_00615 [Candidatus Kaelpia imicola]|nr:hypothetical protein [Candidatus Kaelpia imicola]